MEQNQNLFKPPTKYPYGFTEEQVREAFTIYDAKVKTEIVLQLQKEYPLLLNIFEEDDSISEVILRAIELGTTSGMEMSVNHMDVLNYYREQQKEQGKATYNVTHYDFHENKGISGVLLPNGTFILCGNAEHYMVVQDIEFSIQKQSVYFSSFLEGQGGVVTLSPFGDKTITNEQKYWIEQNFSYLDKEQREMYMMLTGN